jgi:hypothetical protein
MKRLIPFLVLLASLQATAQTTPNLVAHWDFNNGSTTDVVNQWTSAVTGTPSATTGATGLANTALKFNQGDYLIVASDPKMNLSSWTLMATIRPDGFYSGICQVNSILWRGNAYSSTHYQLSFFDNAYDATSSSNGCAIHTPNKEVFIGTPAGNSTFPETDWFQSHQTPSPFISAGTWYCVAAMYDGTAQTVTMFIDGQQVTAPLPWANVYNYNNAPANDLYIGSSNGPTSNWPYFLNAAIDDIKIYDGVFTVQGDGTIPCTKTTDPTDPTDPPNPPNPISVSQAPATQKLNIFPNPATDNITIAVPAHMQSGHIVITNAVGAMVKQVSAAQATIDTHELPAGLYMVRLQSNGETVTGRFTIAR